MEHYTKHKLLINDEINYLPIDSEGAKLFFQLIDMRYEVFQDTKIANAILNRVLHHVTVVSIIEKSYRIKDHFNKENK